MNQAVEALNQYLERAQALQTAMNLFEWDNETQAPEEAENYTARMIGSLSAQYLELMTSEKLKQLLADSQKEKLDELQLGIVREVSEELEKLSCISPEEYRAYSELTAKAAGVWARARKAQDFSLFAPVLKQVIDAQKKFASVRAKEGQSLYDVMLDSYEKGFDTKALDAFFGELKDALIPLVKRAAAASKSVQDDFLCAEYSLESQKKAAAFLAQYAGFDFKRGVLGVSAHPFTTNLHNHDVRITTHYQRRIDSSMFSVIHETGHALYELGISDQLTQTPLGQGTSMGMHECQSRFFENILGRSRAFWEPIYETVAAFFGPPLTEVSLDTFLAAINKVQPGLIRTEADELSYTLHIMIRYELEKLMIEEDIPIEQLPELWNQKYEEYFGLCPKQDAEGILQDIHWSQGSIGYFPSYALGSAFGAQLYAEMKKQLPIEERLRQGNLEPIRSYLKKKIFRYGKQKNSRELLKEVTGEDFSPKYYIRYLTEKYGQ